MPKEKIFSKKLVHTQNKKIVYMFVVRIFKEEINAIENNKYYKL